MNEDILVTSFSGPDQLILISSACSLATRSEVLNWRPRSGMEDHWRSCHVIPLGFQSELRVKSVAQLPAVDIPGVEIDNPDYVAKPLAERDIGSPDLIHSRKQHEIHQEWKALG